MKEYPKWMYGPPGRDGKPQARIFNKDDVVPKGWADHPSKVKQPEPAKEPVKEPEPTPEERLATIVSVREAAVAAGVDVQLSDDASDDEINAVIDKLNAQQGS